MASEYTANGDFDINQLELFVLANYCMFVSSSTHNQDPILLRGAKTTLQGTLPTILITKQNQGFQLPCCQRH